jgi:hypothetical protein
MVRLLSVFLLLPFFRPFIKMNNILPIYH